MDDEKVKGIIEAILFASGRVVKIGELINILELDADIINKLIIEMREDYSKDNRGLEIIRVEDGFQLASKKEYHEYIYPALDKRIKPTLSQASLEVLAIIAYNKNITKADIDAIRGVDSNAAIYRLMEYGLIAHAGKADLPGKPITYKTTDEFLKMFGLESIKDLPELPRYKLDENKQIVIDDLEEKEAPEPKNNIDKNIENKGEEIKDE